MKKSTLALLFVALAVDLATAGWLVYASLYDPTWLIVTRGAFFTSFVDDAAELQRAPTDRHQAGFMTDAESDIADWRLHLASNVPYVMDVLSLKGTTIERVREMVALFSRNGGLVCGQYDGLVDKLVRVNADDGYGCCSDHSEVMLALTAISGIEARETHHTEHTFVEFFSPEANAWVWVDPQYALMARDGHGQYLSLVELRERYLTPEPFAFEFIGTEYHELLDRDPRRQRFYNEPNDFADLTVTWGNNVFAQAESNRLLGSLPKPARQLVGMLLGRIPGYVTVDDNASLLPSILRERRKFVTTWLVVLAFVNLAAVAVTPFRSKRART